LGKTTFFLVGKAALRAKFTNAESGADIQIGQVMM
jgi:hypothetical protein